MQPKQIAKRIRKNLVEQKLKLENYLDLLEKEKTDILIEDPNKLIEHIALEKNIINELTLLKGITEPLEIMYFNSPYKKDKSLIDIKKNIDKLSLQVKTKTSDNVDKLNTVILNVKKNVKGLSKIGISKSAYKHIDSRLVDING